MRKVLIVPPLSWGSTKTAELRAALNGTGVQISTGRGPRLIPRNDAVLIILDGDHVPRTLRAIGEGTRNNKMEPHYFTVPKDKMDQGKPDPDHPQKVLAALAAKIKTIVNGGEANG